MEQAESVASPKKTVADWEAEVTAAGHKIRQAHIGDVLPNGESYYRCDGRPVHVPVTLIDKVLLGNDTSIDKTHHVAPEGGTWYSQKHDLLGYDNVICCYPKPEIENRKKPKMKKRWFSRWFRS